MSYIPTIGLEIHAELKTRTKMFCDSRNDPDEKRPNINICPVCVGYPGTLPVINKKAVEHVLRLGLAVGGQCSDYTEFDRKHYFYPDIPKGYQISQYKYPLVRGGEIAGVKLTRIHLEEDTARSTHPDGKVGRDYSLIDFNRAGVPLMELVTEPVIHDTETAVRFAKELQLLLQYLGASEANMEKGEMRVEANVSVSADNALGTKVEVKNLNSFKVVEKAIAQEIERQSALLEAGEKVVQETRGFDDMKGQTWSQRQKEESHDYRYFPDPDLPKLIVSKIPEFSVEMIRKTMPELPRERRERLARIGLKKDDVELYVNFKEVGDYFDVVSKFLKSNVLQLASNYIVSDFVGFIKNKTAGRFEEMTKIAPEKFVELIVLLEVGTLSSRGAKDVLPLMFETGEGAAELAKKHGLVQTSDEGTLRSIVKEVIEENEKVVAEFRAGKTTPLQYLIGQAMKKSKGSANPAVLRKLFEDLLK